MRRSLGWWVGVAVLAAGCGSSSDGASGAPASSPYLAGFEPPAATADQIQIVSPIIHAIPAASDATYCTYVPNPFPSDQDVVQSFGIQSKFGHHALLMAPTDTHPPEDPRPCTDADMSHTRFLAGATDAGGNLVIPDGVAVRVKAGNTLLIQTHWINTSPEPVDAQAAFNVTVRPPDGSRQLTQTFTAYSTQIDIKAHATFHAETSCTVQQDLQFFTIAGHEHEWGKHVKLEQISGVDQSATTLYDENWTAEYQSNPPRKVYPVATPLVFKKGDAMKVSCDWDNNGDKELIFPREMCVGFGFFFPATADIDCGDGLWVFGG